MSATGSKCRCSPDLTADGEGAILSDAARAHRCRLSAGRHQRHICAPDRPMAVGAARPVVHCREPSRRWRQHCHGIGHPGGARRLHVAAGYSIDAWNATLYDNLKYNFVRNTAPVATIARGTGLLVVHPSFPAKSVADSYECVRESDSVEIISIGFFVPNPRWSHE